jgi:ATP-dependent Lon protease
MSRMPLFILDAVLLPGGDLSIHVFEPRYRKMIARCMQEPRSFGVIRIHENLISEVGCEAVIARRLHHYADGRLDILVRGIDRFRVTTIVENEDGYMEADTIMITEGPEETDHSIEDRLEQLYKHYASIAADMQEDAPPRGPRWSYRLADRIGLDAHSRQELLLMMSENERLERILHHLSVLIPLREKKEQIQDQVRGNGKLKPGMPGKTT